MQKQPQQQSQQRQQLKEKNSTVNDSTSTKRIKTKESDMSRHKSIDNLNDKKDGDRNSTSRNPMDGLKRNHQQHEQHQQPLSETRICIKNIPINFNENNVKQFLHEQLSKLLLKEHNTLEKVIITDCRVLKNAVTGKSRRVAFIGFSSSFIAKFCQLKLNKSYCHNARIIIEFAHLPTTKKSKQEEQEEKETTNPVADSDSKKQQQQKQDNFLSSIIGENKSKASKRKIWSNDDDDENDNMIPLAKNSLKISIDQNEIPKQTSETPIHEEKDDDDMSTTSSSSSSSSSTSSTTSGANDKDDGKVKTTKVGEKNESKVIDDITGNIDDDLNFFLRSKQVHVDDLDLQKGESSTGKDVTIDNGSNNYDGKSVDSTSTNSSNDSDDYDNDDDDQVDPTIRSNPLKDRIDDIGTKNDKASTKPQKEQEVRNAVAVGAMNKEHKVVNKEHKVENNRTRNKDANEKNYDSEDDENDIGNNNTDLDSNRIFIRNLPFQVTESDLRNLFQQKESDSTTTISTIVECHIPIDDQKRNKGYAFITFTNPQSASDAISHYDGHDFQGRLLHILPARKVVDVSTSTLDSTNTNTYKQKNELLRRQQAMNDTTGWSSSFVRGDAVIDTLASRLGLSKGTILSVKDNLKSGDAAVRLALGETAIIEENRQYFNQFNINMDALVSFSGNKNNKNNKNKDNTIDQERSTTSILVKNLPSDTTKEELVKLFVTIGKTSDDVQILLPPSRTIAVIEYTHPNDAKQAFKRLAYRRFKSVPLYLEWAPLNARDNQTISNNNDTDSTEKKQLDSSTVAESSLSSNQNALGNLSNNVTSNDDDDEVRTDIDNIVTPSIYVKNLNFTTTEEQLLQHFTKQFNNVRAVRIPQKVAPIKRKLLAESTTTTTESSSATAMQSMGYGFVEFGSNKSVQDAIRTLQGSVLDGHTLVLKPSSNNQGLNTTKAAQDKLLNNKKSSNNDKVLQTKLMVRNVPFQASRKELLQLFGSFGTLKRVRLPKKFDGSHRGFAFIEYLSSKEAEAAMKTLSKTHLYGRHLVLEWATSDDESNNILELRAKAERDVVRTTTTSSSSSATAIPNNNKNNKRTRVE